MAATASALANFQKASFDCPPLGLINGQVRHATAPRNVIPPILQSMLAGSQHAEAGQSTAGGIAGLGHDPSCTFLTA